jgi:outer membrane protein TolC
VNVAKTQQAVASANEVLTQFQVETQAASAFFNLLGTQCLVKSAQANLDRTQVFEHSVAVYVKSGLRPGADDSRALAEVAAAKTLLIQAQKNEAVANAQLAELMGMAGEDIAVETTPFLQQLPSDTTAIPAALENHPLALLQKTQIELVKQRETVLAHTYFPKLDVLGVANGRGSGLDQVTGKALGGGYGLYPNRVNLGVGLNLSFSAMDIFSIKAREKIEHWNETAEQARYQQTMQTLISGFSQAKSILNAANAIAQNAPVQLAAAKTNELQVRTRYNVGLSTIVDVADAQRVLTQAEVEEYLAQLGVWTALFQIAEAQGNVDPFLDLTRFTPHTTSTQTKGGP